jgi:hypothetical protein
VLRLMARRAKCDQVIQVIVAEFAPLRQMMYMQVFWRPAVLTSPSIPFKHSESEYVVVSGVKLQSGLLLAKSHFSDYPPFSRFAPARKSAQIISRQ